MHMLIIVIANSPIPTSQLEGEGREREGKEGGREGGRRAEAYTELYT